LALYILSVSSLVLSFLFFFFFLSFGAFLCVVGFFFVLFGFFFFFFFVFSFFFSFFLLERIPRFPVELKIQPFPQVHVTRSYLFFLFSYQ